MIEQERAKQAEAIEKRLEAGRDDLGAKQRKREQALQDKREVVARKVKDLYEGVDESMRKEEKMWLNRGAGWIHKAQRKIKAKAEDDERKQKMEKERKRRRKLRA